MASRPRLQCISKEYHKQNFLWPFFIAIVGLSIDYFKNHDLYQKQFSTSKNKFCHSILQ